MGKGENGGAAHCDVCNQVFVFEARDIFSGEIFCPACMSRTDPDHREDSMRAIRERFPEAKLYRIKRPASRQKTSAHAR